MYTWLVKKIKFELIKIILMFLFKGGLSPDIGTIDQMRTIERDQEIPHRGGFCDLMWSDPDEIDWWAISPRGAGWLFGEKPTNQFMHNNQLTLIARAHQLVQEGENFSHASSYYDFMHLVTRI
jgi:diadenosine tetraphosphatase ApaH/serine/threonine PP2A family protein phosphatase